MASAPPANSAADQKAKRISTILGIVYSIVINAVFPFLIYTLLKNYTQLSDFWALVISSIPPIIDSLVSVIRKGRIDLIAGVVLLGIAVSIILIFLGGSPRLLLIRESFFTAAFGLAYLVSFLFPRPLGFYFARHFVTGNVPEKVAWFNSLWQYPGFRSSMRLSTLVWGLGFVLEAVVRIFLVFTLPIAQFLLISPFVFYGILGGIMLWTVLYSRAGQRRMEAAMPEHLKAPDAGA